MDREQRKLAGLELQRESLQQILSEGFGADLHPHEILHATPHHPGAKGSGPEFDRYFRASGEAHHHGHAAHEMSARIANKEAEGTEAQHHNAYIAHEHARNLHTHAAAMAVRAGAPWMETVHRGEATKHEKSMAKHEKKFKR